MERLERGPMPAVAAEPGARAAAVTALREGLPPIPRRMQSLPVEARGYPVPWFVEWINGVPDFRVMDRRKWGLSLRFGHCWLCGEPVGASRTFVIGPMCGVTRTTSEPANHLECAEFAAKACPFMTLPRAKYRIAGLPSGHIEAAGMPIDRNPGVTCLWTTREFSVFRAHAGNEGQLIRIGEPRDVAWFCEGRSATRAEVWHSVETGLPLLEKAARDQEAAEHRTDCMDALRATVQEFERYLPPAPPR
jgi:hypothetical protein